MEFLPMLLPNQDIHAEFSSEPSYALANPAFVGSLESKPAGLGLLSS